MSGQLPDRPERDRLLDHDYDGIREYDNPMPRWWLATFWITIVFSVVYVLNVPYIGIGKGRIADYEADLAVAREFAARNDPLARLTADSLLQSARNPEIVAVGRATYASMCSACHAADGGGGIGPNLTDPYWLHGGAPLEILRTINSGVLEKGMPPWGKTLKPDQLRAVASYVMTLQGAKTAAPKAPQGTRPDSAAPRTPAS